LDHRVGDIVDEFAPGGPLFSRIELNVASENPNPSPGDRVYVVARIVCGGAPRKCGGLAFRFLATETVLVDDPSRWRPVRRTRTIVAADIEHAAFTVQPGAPTVLGAFVTIPDDAPPSYVGERAVIEYRVTATLELRWRDVNASTVLLVGTSPPRSLGSRGDAVERTDPTSGSDQPVLELSLASSDVLLGFPFRGAFAVTNGRPRDVRAVELALVTTEHVRGQSPREAHRVARIVQEDPLDGLTTSFAVVFPETSPPTFETSWVDVYHQLELRALVARGENVALTIPARVFRSSEAPPAAPAELTEILVSSVESRFRRALDVVGDSGGTVLSADLTRGTAVIDLFGHEQTIRTRDIPNNPPELVASLRWPALGIDLRVRPRDTRRGRFAARFDTGAREARQLDFLLDAETRDLLRAFATVNANDDGAIVSDPRLTMAAPELEGFVRQIVALQRRMSNAGERMPPPRALQDTLPAYRAFAARSGARFRPGDLSLRVEVRGVVVEISHDFTGSEPTGSRAVAWLPRTAFAETMHRAPRDYLASLESELDAKVTVEKSRLIVTMEVVRNPERLDPVVATMVAAVERLRRTEGTPYR